MDLSANSISDKGATELSKFLDKNKTVLHLDLHNNKIGLHGVQALQKSLFGNITLTHLNIRTVTPPPPRKSGAGATGTAD